MKNVKEAKYMGQIISNDGKNDKTVKDRCNKGTGTSNQIFIFLSDICFGRHFYSLGLLLRDTNLVSKMLSSAESWYGINQDQIRKC